jgi:putative oxidoreductase
MTSQATAALTSADSTSLPLSRAWAATRASWTPLVQRAVLAAVMFSHGAQKLLGWWGGYGFEGTMGFLTGTVGMPAALAVGVILLEFVGPVLMLLGLGVRPIALGFIGLMVGAIATVHAPFGFFMNWSGAQAGEGFEFHLLLIALALGLVVQGAGRLSLDRWIARRAT